MKNFRVGAQCLKIEQLRDICPFPKKVKFLYSMFTLLCVIMREMSAVTSEKSRMYFFTIKRTFSYHKTRRIPYLVHDMIGTNLLGLQASDGKIKDVKFESELLFYVTSGLVVNRITFKGVILNHE